MYDIHYTYIQITQTIENCILFLMVAQQKKSCKASMCSICAALQHFEQILILLRCPYDVIHLHV